MIYKNPILKGFYPDPSVCRAGDKYYMVCSTFQYMPGVPVFESDDLVNWVQVGNALTRPSQVELHSVPSSGGVFAPTIRYHNGRFYMVTTNDTLHRNFYVYTDDITGEWSEPHYVDQGGIDPSLLFDGDKVYFLSNGEDDFGSWGITQCEIDIETGKKLTPSKTIWHGSGGRYLESPHMYKIGDYYYLTAAEGGTEYGHMITYARSDSPWGEFVGYKNNPVLTNRNRGGFAIQGVGHGELIESKNGEWFFIHLAYRQIGQFEMYHHLGREVYMTPAYFDENGWIYCKNNSSTEFEYEIVGDFEQRKLPVYNMKNIDRRLELLFLRENKSENYLLSDDKYILHATKTTIDEPLSPTFVGIRQRDMCGKLTCNLSTDGCESGISVYMDERHHYDIAVRKPANDGYEAVVKLNIGDIKHEQATFSLPDNSVQIGISFDSHGYSFSANGEYLARASTRYLSSEVAGGFTGVILAMYAQGNGSAEFDGLEITYYE